MSNSSEAYDACASLTDPVEAGVHAMYSEIGEHAGLDHATADAVASIPSDFVGHEGGGWEAVCATMFGSPEAHDAAPSSMHEDTPAATHDDAGSAGHGDAGGGATSGGTSGGTDGGAGSGGGSGGGDGGGGAAQ